jgi:hypothetical protein
MPQISRRQAIRGGIATAGAVALSAGVAGTAGAVSPSSAPGDSHILPVRGRIPRLAAVVTEYRPNAHADVILSKLLEGYTLHGVQTEPRVEIVSLYLDQVPSNDVGHYMAQKHGIPIFDTPAEALAVGRTGKVDVDGVIIVGEHGNYPTLPDGTKLYPHRRLFESVLSAMIASNRFVPIFSDKQLGVTWENTQYIFSNARRYGIPMLSGSTVPLGWRLPLPSLTYPLNTPFDDAMALGYSSLASYGFHTLEGLQCMVERRPGGETGLKSIQTLSGDAVWAAGDAGLWSWSLLEAGVQAIREGSGRVRDGDVRTLVRNPIAMLLEYNDGFKASALMLSGAIDDFGFAASVGGQISATNMALQGDYPFSHFTMLDRQIEYLMLNRQEPYPLERTVLTSGALAKAIISNANDGAVVQTPDLDIHYQAVADPSGTLEPTGTGIGEDIPVPDGIRPYPTP